MLIMDNSVYKSRGRGARRLFAFQSLGALISLVIVLFVFSLTGCSTNSGDDTYQEELRSGAGPTVIRVTGFGAQIDVKGKPPETQRLLAMRAATLDGYRSLAERVYGTVVVGSSTVNDFVLEHDHIRARVDSYISGAKVVAMNELGGGNFEAVIELVLEPPLQQYLSHANYYKKVEHGRSSDKNALSSKTNDLYFIK